MIGEIIFWGGMGGGRGAIVLDDHLETILMKYINLFESDLITLYTGQLDRQEMSYQVTGCNQTNVNFQSIFIVVPVVLKQVYLHLSSKRLRDLNPLKNTRKINELCKLVLFVLMA